MHISLLSFPVSSSYPCLVVSPLIPHYFRLFVIIVMVFFGMRLERVCPDAVILTPPKSPRIVPMFRICWCVPVRWEWPPVSPPQWEASHAHFYPACIAPCICTVHSSKHNIYSSLISFLLFSVFVLSWYACKALVCLFVVTLNESTKLYIHLILSFFLCFFLSIIPFISPSIRLYSFFLFLFHLYFSLPPTQ